MNDDFFIPEEDVLTAEFADYAVRLAGGGPGGLRDAAILALSAVRAGHSCCELDKCGEAGKRVGAMSAVPGVLEENPDGGALMVRRKKLLYLNRCFAYENFIAGAIASRLAAPPPEPVSRELLNLVAPVPASDPDQAAAVLNCLNSNFAVITGGAGTGKTTVAAAVAALELIRDPRLRIIAAAPTGKAKSRLVTAMADEIPNMRLTAETAAAIEAISGNSYTFEAALGIGYANTEPVYDAANPIAADLVIVDETSMASLKRIAQLFRALPERCRVVLLGDRNQLNSVEAGSVFAEICASERLNGRGTVSVLKRNFRSRANPFLIRAAGAVASLDRPEERIRAVEAAAAESAALPASDPTGRFQILNPEGRSLGALLKTVIRDLWHLEKPDSLPAALELLEKMKILTPLREGPLGTIACNRAAAEIFGVGEGENGSPVLVTANDRATGLYNGDCGVFWDGEVVFPALPGEEEQRSFPVSELPPWECAWAMTVHKSQGSGFEKVLFPVPEYAGRVMSCELFYTAVTRARRDVVICGRDRDIAKALGRRIRRFSGLAETLDEWIAPGELFF